MDKDRAFTYTGQLGSQKIYYVILYGFGIREWMVPHYCVHTKTHLLRTRLARHGTRPRKWTRLGTFKAYTTLKKRLLN